MEITIRDANGEPTTISLDRPSSDSPTWIKLDNGSDEIEVKLIELQKAIRALE